MTEQQKRQVEKAKRTGPGVQRPTQRKRPWVHRKAEKVVWDMDYIHKHLDAKKNALTWASQGQGNWSKHWAQYAGDMLNLAKGKYHGKKPPVPPQCLGSSQHTRPHNRPMYLQNVRI